MPSNLCDFYFTAKVEFVSVQNCNRSCTFIFGVEFELSDVLLTFGVFVFESTFAVEIKGFAFESSEIYSKFKMAVLTVNVKRVLSESMLCAKKRGLLASS